MANFFSTLFGGGAEREAADRNRAALGQYTLDSNRALDRGLQRSEDALRQGSAAGDVFNQANYNLYGGLRNAGRNILDRGGIDSLAALDAAKGYYDPLAGLGAKYGDATDLYLKSLGVKGAQGNADAAAAFQAGPGYQFTRDQGLDALNRRRAAAGMLNSGNADVDALKFGTGLANQTYGDWQARLGGFVNPELAATQGAATGRAGVGANIANMIGQDTAARLNLEQGVTGAQAGANSAQGQNALALGNSLAGLYTGDASNRVGVYGNNVSGQMAQNNLQAQGEAQGSRNLLNAGMGLASLAAGSFGGGGMFGASGAFGANGAFGRGGGGASGYRPGTGWGWLD